MSKQATIKVAHFLYFGPGSTDVRNGEPRYKVIVVKNSTAYSPGQVLSRGEVDDLCDMSVYDVTIVGLDPTKGAA